MVVKQCENIKIEEEDLTKIIKQSLDEGKFKIASFLIDTFKDHSVFNAADFIIEAVYYGSTKLTQQLLNEIEDINQIKEKFTNRTPLHYALINNKQRLVKLLLDKGIHIPSDKDKSGKFIYNYTKNKKIITLLKNYGKKGN